MSSERRTQSPDLEVALLREVEKLSSSIEAAKGVGDVICALHSLAVRLFPIESTALAGVLDEPHKGKVLDASVSIYSQRERWKHAFYRVAFPTVARVLIYNVGLDWLACFPRTARIQVYDRFFISTPAIEIIQVLVPCLASNDPKEVGNSNVVCSNVERLLVLCLLENQGIKSIAQEFVEVFSCDKYAYGVSALDNISFGARMSQLLSSIPDKAGLASSAALSAHSFFKQVTNQLLDIAEERAVQLFSELDILLMPIRDGMFSFIGEMFARICRRGSADTLLAAVIPRLLDHVHSCMSRGVDPSSPNVLESNPRLLFWFNLIGHLKDSYAVEKMSEELLQQLETGEIDDEEAYWILWVLYHKSFEFQPRTRAMFSEKFLLCKLYPFACLKWILHLSVFEHPPQATFVKTQNTQSLLSTTQHLLDMWSKREFIQSATIEKQAYITAAVGLCLERISKEEMEAARNVMNSILQGVSCRLESPLDIVRKMASSIALIFSKVVDPGNPLYLDDTQTDSIDWEFGLISSKHRRKMKSLASYGRTLVVESPSPSKITGFLDSKVNKKDNKLDKHLKLSDARQLDPDEVIDPAQVLEEFHSECSDSESDASTVSSDSSLQPYDMTDDDSDLRNKISQISELFTALRKSDDPDGVEQALNVAEKLIRASPDELQHSAGDLVKTLVYIRCADLAVEGEEDSVEDKRQKVLIALLVMCPFESVDVMTGLLYSSNLDVSQRIMIIDVMTEAALELYNSKTMRINHQQANLISSISDRRPWYLPGDEGPKGSGRWEEVPGRESPLNWSLRFERTLPSRPGQVKAGKSRRWSFPAVKTQDSRVTWSQNRFPLYAAAFMLPSMRGFDKRKHGVDFLGKDFIVLGKLIHMLGVCIRCVAMHPEASALAPSLLDMLRSRDVSHHSEAYVRRAVLFAASCILVALHPSFIASALIGGQEEVSKGLDWIHTWALHVAETDPDTECTTMAMTCLQLHAEMALQTSRSLESSDFSNFGTGKSQAVKRDIILPSARITEL